jgi:hypothetical protein
MKGEYMKVIKKEKDKDVIYVQKGDLGFLNMCDEDIPASIYMKTFCQEITIIDERNRLDYIKFDESEEVNYFMNLQFILNFNEYENLSLEDIESKGKEIADSINEIVDKYNLMNEKDKKNNTSLISQYEKLEYLYNSVVLIYNQKLNGISFSLPITTSEQKKKIRRKK